LIFWGGAATACFVIAAHQPAVFRSGVRGLPPVASAAVLHIGPQVRRLSLRPLPHLHPPNLTISHYSLFPIPIRSVFLYFCRSKTHKTNTTQNDLSYSFFNIGDIPGNDRSYVIFGMYRLLRNQTTETPFRPGHPRNRRKYRIPHGQIFVLDTAYKTFIRKISGQNKTLAKNHLQPLQLLYFNKSGELISYFINCNAGGFPNLKWNRNGMLDSFPPASQTTPDALFSFHDLLKFIKTPDGKKPNPKEFSHATYKTVVFWSVFMGRQSKRLIHQAEENYKLTNDKSAKLIFVNTDDLFTETN
jgi:hypothetical protein